MHLFTDQLVLSMLSPKPGVSTIVSLTLTPSSVMVEVVRVTLIVDGMRWLGPGYSSGTIRSHEKSEFRNVLLPRPDSPWQPMGPRQ